MTTTTELPHDLARAMRGATAALLKAEKLSAMMTETGSAISAALGEEHDLSRQCGQLEIEGGDTGKLHERLAASAVERAASGRRRAAAADGLLHMSRELDEGRQALIWARDLYGSGIVEEFSIRWAQACHALAVLRIEAEMLGKALGTTVPTPAPYAPKINAIYAEERLELHPVPATGPIAPPPLPPALVEVVAILDRIDAVRAMGQAVRQSVDLTKTFFTTARERGAWRGEMAGTFEVVRAFDVLGSHFEVGALVSREVMSEGLIDRFWRGRCLWPVAENAVAA
jgi:hypothetical protein